MSYNHGDGIWPVQGETIEGNKNQPPPSHHLPPWEVSVVEVQDIQWGKDPKNSSCQMPEEESPWGLPRKAIPADADWSLVSFNLHNHLWGSIFIFLIFYLRKRRPREQVSYPRTCTWPVRVGSGYSEPRQSGSPACALISSCMYCPSGKSELKNLTDERAHQARKWKSHQGGSGRWALWQQSREGAWDGSCGMRGRGSVLGWQRLWCL